MKRMLVMLALMVGALALAAVGVADPGPHGKSKRKHPAKFTFVMANTDNGSCGAQWATLQEKRTFIVKDNGDGTFRVWRRDRGTFTTTGPASPGACETSKPHGTVVHAGARGKFHGWLVGTVSGGTYDPNATCAGPAEVCGATDTFIATHFGAAAKFSCFENSTDCRFTFQYKAKKKQGLALRRWRDWGRGAGTMLHEHFKGDISDNRVS